MIKIEGDVRPITDVFASVDVIRREFTKPRNLGVISNLAAEATLQGFAEFADKSAANDAAGLGHMYEWGQLGQESGRLWRLIVGGTNYNKIATFDYKEAEVATPRGANSQDKRQEGHVFRWKSAIMELGIRTTQEPRNGGTLAIPTKEPLNYSGESKQSGGTMWFSKQAIMTTPSYDARGSFTNLWLTYFAGAAERVVIETVEKTSEQFFKNYSKGFVKFRPKVNPNPKVARLFVKSTLGENYGQKQVGGFMTAAEKAAQLARAQRVADALE